MFLMSAAHPYYVTRECHQRLCMYFCIVYHLDRLYNRVMKRLMFRGNNYLHHLCNKPCTQALNLLLAREKEQGSYC